MSPSSVTPVATPVIPKLSCPGVVVEVGHAKIAPLSGAVPLKPMEAIGLVTQPDAVTTWPDAREGDSSSTSAAAAAALTDSTRRDTMATDREIQRDTRGPAGTQWQCAK